MADRSERPITPGQPYVEVEYDYEYKSKDRTITIKQGECYLLVKKTNGDWWQVRKDESSKTFYVPAQYVREVRRALMPPSKPLPNAAGGVGTRGGCAKDRPNFLEVKQSNDSMNKRSPIPPLLPGQQVALQPPKDDKGSPKSPRSQGPQAFPNVQHESLPRTPAESPIGHRSPLDLDEDSDGNGEKVRDGEIERKKGGSDRDKHKRREGKDGEKEKKRDAERRIKGEKTGYGEEKKLEGVQDKTIPFGDSPREASEKNRNDSESGDELSSSSTEHLQERSDSPVYANLQDLKITQTSLPPLPLSSPLNTHGDWETHKDANGRQFYYNRTTEERTWKPPRARDSINKKEERLPTTSTDTETLSSEENYLSSQSDSQYGSPPRGWSEELDENGHTLYVCDYTNEKWLKHTDDQGRLYYYSADGYRSEWELPNTTTHVNRNVSKTCSLDRKQPAPLIMNKWRHSTYMLEANEKLKQKSIKKRRVFSIRSGSSRPHPYRPQEHSKGGIPDFEYHDPSSPKHPHSPFEKSGVLNMTKITENGKKVRKNWTSSFTVLQGSQLIFGKNQGTATSWFGSHQSKPEFVVDLRGATVEKASKDKSSKKHVLEVKARQGTELLIHSDSEAFINEWFKALTDAINTHAWESDEAIEEDMPESPGPEKHDKEKDQDQEKKTKTKLKKFLTRRPTLQSVKDKGYIKDLVFGCNLITLCQREKTTVPHFVKMCIEHVENEGLHFDGLYRVSGNLSVIQKLRFAVNHDEKINLADSKWEDIHVTTGALKMFFRELPEPLFPSALFSDFVNSIKIPDYKHKVQAIKELVKQLHRANQDTMQELFKHLRKVIEHGEQNRMTFQGVAIVFGPTLLRPEIENIQMAVSMVYQNQIVELILTEYEAIFTR